MTDKEKTLVERFRALMAKDEIAPIFIERAARDPFLFFREGLPLGYLTVLYGHPHAPLLDVRRPGTIFIDTEMRLDHKAIAERVGVKLADVKPDIIFDSIASVLAQPSTRPAAPHRIDESEIRVMLQVLAARRPAGLLDRELEEKKCTCGATATRKAGKSGWPGTDVCDRCWDLDFRENE